MSVGIFLSGSGARITFHAGVMDALRELGVTVDQFLGASGGGIHSVLTVCGCRGDLWFDDRIPICKNNSIIRPPTLKESLSFILKPDFLTQYGGKLNLAIINQKVKILSTQKFFKAIVFNAFASIEDLKIKLLASSSLPFFTTFPVKIENRRYADGFFGYFYRKLDFAKLINTDLRIASLALPTNHKVKNNSDSTFIYVIKEGKYNPVNIMHVSYDKAKRFYEDGYEQVMKSRIKDYL